MIQKGIWEANFRQLQTRQKLADTPTLAQRVKMFRTTFGVGAKPRWNDKLVVAFASALLEGVRMETGK